MATITTSQQASKSGARSGRQAPRISKQHAIWNNLRRSGRDSLAALLAEEICRTALRIVRLIRKQSPYSRRVLVVKPYPAGLDRLSFAQESEYLSACNKDIQRLSRANRWAGHLDREIMLQAHLAGATRGTRSGISNCDK